MNHVVLKVCCNASYAGHTRPAILKSRYGVFQQYKQVMPLFIAFLCSNGKS